MGKTLAALLALACLPRAARAWEPATPAAVQARIDELRLAWRDRSEAEVVADKLNRARQPRPAWVSRVAWKVELPPVTFYFAVGQSSRADAAAAPAPAPVPPPAPAPGPAQAKAPPAGTAQTAAPAGASAPPAPAAPIHPLDFWLDESKGVLYTLVVQAR